MQMEKLKSIGSIDQGSIQRKDPFIEPIGQSKILEKWKDEGKKN